MWLATALSRNLCELFLINEYSNEKPNILPSRLYTCKSLVILKLRGEIRPDVPRLSCLPSLKTLELLLDKYFQGGPLRRFLFICPVLENLLMNCGWDDYDKGLITVTVPSLQRLTLYLHSQTEGGMLPRGLVIDSPSLKYLKLRDRHQWSRPGFSIETMPDLEEAYVNVQYWDSSNLLARLLEDSPNVRVLDIFEIDHDDRDYEELISTVRTVRESVLSNLRTFNWSRYFERRPQEMDLAVYILGEKWSLKDCNNLV
ncbi:unnamed protein product [Brassica rapa]|uniref:Uncharacterized protein n=2 Tax=Brassica TaxID=3705 RepID=A0A3P5Y535_BRACM|nr:unnamed protein product [Brassica napus]CAG7860397.1 unnamed protein product [Brassica rapa]CDY16725.1 BnaA09g06570D [Brassica napus]VDC58864.1 unnamed protein product [Brassica rapa]